MDDIFNDADLRWAKAENRLGGKTQCVICGEDNPHCLELHHLAGKAYGDDLVCICRNCHRKLSDDQRDHPNSAGEPTRLEQIGRLLMGIGDLLVALGAQLKAIGEELFDVCLIPGGEAAP